MTHKLTPHVLTVGTSQEIETNVQDIEDMKTKQKAIQEVRMENGRKPSSS